MQHQYVIKARLAPNVGDWTAPDRRVVDVTHPFPEDGFSYADLEAGLCEGYVRVTEVLDLD